MVIAAVVGRSFSIAGSVIAKATRAAAAAAAPAAVMSNSMMLQVRSLRGPQFDNQISAVVDTIQLNFVLTVIAPKLLQAVEKLVILLMDEILHHLGSLNYCNS